MGKISIAFLTMAVLPFLPAAQAQKPAPTRYTVIDLGTLGGVFGSSATSVNK
jgi:hypothetical protein